MKGKRKEITFESIATDLSVLLKHIESISFSKYEAMVESDRAKLKNVNEKVKDLIRILVS